MFDPHKWDIVWEGKDQTFHWLTIDDKVTAEPDSGSYWQASVCCDLHDWWRLCCDSLSLPPLSEHLIDFFFHIFQKNDCWKKKKTLILKETTGHFLPSNNWNSRSPQRAGGTTVASHPEGCGHTLGLRLLSRASVDSLLRCSFLTPITATFPWGKRGMCFVYRCDFNLTRWEPCPHQKMANPRNHNRRMTEGKTSQIMILEFVKINGNLALASTLKKKKKCRIWKQTKWRSLNSWM